MLNFQMIPPPPFIHPFLSLGSFHPPQTNQFASSPSILRTQNPPSLLSRTAIFIFGSTSHQFDTLCRPPSPIPQTSYFSFFPPRSVVYRPPTQLMITRWFHSERRPLCVMGSLLAADQRASRGILGGGAEGEKSSPHHYTCRVTFGIENGWRNGVCVCVWFAH